jgi:hypothetical protein
MESRQHGCGARVKHALSGVGFFMRSMGGWFVISFLGSSSVVQTRRHRQLMQALNELPMAEQAGDDTVPGATPQAQIYALPRVTPWPLRCRRGAPGC